MSGASEYENLLYGHTPEYTGGEPTLSDVLQRNALGGYLPAGSAEMARRGPWMRDRMPESLADFLAASLQYAPMAFRASGAALPPRWQNTYHGTPDPAFALQNKPIWSEPGQSRASHFASSGPGEPGAIAPLRVDTADYVTVRPGSILEQIDNRFGSANQLYRDGRNWFGDLLQVLGKKGVQYENLGRDRGPATLSLDPRTVRSRFDPEGAQPKAAPVIPEYLRRALEDDFQ